MRSIFKTKLARPREDEFLRFGTFLLARCRREADFGLGFLGFYRIIQDCQLLSSFRGFSASQLVQWLLDFYGLCSSYFASSLVPEYLHEKPEVQGGFAYCPAQNEHSRKYMVSLQSSCYRFLWGICGQVPLSLREPCANLARNSECFK